ncbi:MAG: filamentous hemagglutinin N-terminal domain-containing protein [Verrucomicrobiales bacterium]|nr:filamentous hemagglutinin N-terminal domain-containing protein [Verrucomicrobiales bacterium]
MQRPPTDRLPLHHRMAAALAIAALAFSPGAGANPLGEAVRHGAVTFERVDGQLRILQASDKAIIDWESFSIGAGELTEFLQPGSRSAALNRVRGASASTIEGALRANGRVYLINPNGILVGPGGTIDVGGFVGSTLDVSDGEFLAGGDLNFAGGSQAGIVNLGSISALDGDVILIAATVENAGTIRAPQGTAALAAGNDVLLAESGEERVFVRGASGGAKANGVTNTGNIEANIAELKAHGGNIYGMAVKNEGRVAATGVTREGGQIFLRANGGPVRTTGTLKARKGGGAGGRITVDAGAEGKTEVGGRVDAKGETGKGGEIVVLGNEIDVMPGSLVIADGETGGGTILIGGGVRGEDPAYHNAKRVTVGEGATLSANAITNGNGGQIVVFAQDSLTFLGNISATGGREGGNGGWVELSGKNSVTIPNLAGRIDLSASNGQGGTLLFDPIDTTVIGGSDEGPIGGSPVIANTLYANDIANFLNNSGSLVVETDDPYGEDFGDITIQSNVAISWTSNNSLTFNAVRDFNMESFSSITNTGAGGVTVNAGRSIFMTVGSSMSTNSGSINLNANTDGTALGTGTGIMLNNADVTTADGDITMNAVGNADPVSGDLIGVRVQNGSVVSATGGGSIFLSGKGGAGVGTNIGVSVSDTGTRVQTNTGDLMIEGFGADTASGANNDGIEVAFGAEVLSNGGNITLQGSAGSGTGGLNGVALLFSGTKVKSVNGSVVIEGIGHELGNLSNTGVIMFQAEVESTNNLVKIEGQGGAGGVAMQGASSVFTQTGSIDINGEAVAGNFAGITLNGVSILAAGGGAIHLKGEGSGTGLAISSVNVANVLGNGTEDVILESLGGDVTFTNAVSADLLQFRDSTGASNVNFSLTNAGNDVNGISGFGTGTLGAIGSVDYKDADGFEVGAFLGGDGIVASGDVTLFSAGSFTDRITVTNQISSLGGDISITGNSLSQTNTGAITTNAGDISLAATVAGLNDLRGTISSQGGHISLSGHDFALLGTQVSTNGTGEVSVTAARSIQIEDGANFSVVNGAMSFSANTGTPVNGDFRGIGTSSATFTTTGAGGITFTGVGGASASSESFGNDGVYFGFGTQISSLGTGSGAGGITVHGTGGGGESAGSGVIIWGSTTFIESEVGAISITGEGGDGDWGNASGVGIYDDAEIRSLGGVNGAATITIHGTGGGVGWNNTGVEIMGWSTGIHSAYGDISITGIGGGDGTDSDNHGVFVENISETIESTGTGPNAAKITIHGTGGIGTENNDGVSTNGYVTVTSVDGAISITGIGGTGTGSGGSNQGVFIGNEATIASTGFGDVTIDGQGGTGGDNNDGVRLSGGDSVIEVLDGDLSISGTGGGDIYSQKNRGVRVIASTVQALGGGDLSIIGHGGQGFSENDGIQTENGGSVTVKDGFLYLEGRAGGDLGIGVNATANSGRYRSTGNGAVSILGSGRGGAAGVNLSNPAAPLGGANAGFVTVEADGGNLVLSAAATASGDVTLSSHGLTQIDAAVESTFGDLFIQGNQIQVNAPVTANYGEITFQIDGQDRGISGTVFVNSTISFGTDLSFIGGDGTADLVTFDGLGGPISFHLDRLSAIENLTGTRSSEDVLIGNNAATQYLFSGEDVFDAGGVRVTSFENLTGGDGDDLFQFGAGSSLSGHLNGGGGTRNELSYIGFDEAVEVNLANQTATAIGDGFENIQDFTGSPQIDTVIGPNTDSVYEITGPDFLTVGGTTIDGFENLIGGSGSDRFKIHTNGSLSGYLDGGFSEGLTTNTLDYSSHLGTGIAVDLSGQPKAMATGIGEGFEGINDFVGSPSLADVFKGPGAGTTYQITGANTFRTPLVTATAFENLTGGGGADTFQMGAGASLTGRLDGAGGPDTLNYTGFGGPVTVNLGSATATGLGSIAGLENFIGSAAPDTFATNGGNDIFNITANNAGNVNGTATFTSFEVLNGGSGNDRFNFLNQATVALIDGGAGSDTLFLNDSNLGGNNIYNITANRITRNPTYTFAGMEILQLVLGPGNDTVNSGFFGFTQLIDGGPGNDTLNLPGVVSLDEGNPIGNVFHFGFEAPRQTAAIDLGDILQLQVDQQIGNFDIDNQGGFTSENRFNTSSPNLMQQITGLGGAFSAATTVLAGQALVISTDTNPYLIFIPFSLDGSGLTPSNLAIAALAENLNIAANVELAQALGLGEGLLLVMPDGPFAIDLSGVPADPSVLAALQETLAIAALRELFDALGIPVAVGVTGADGPLSVALDGVPPGQPVIVLLDEQLGDTSYNELNAALGGN